MFSPAFCCIISCCWSSISISGDIRTRTRHTSLPLSNKRLNSVWIRKSPGDITQIHCRLSGTAADPSWSSWAHWESALLCHPLKLCLIRFLPIPPNCRLIVSPFLFLFYFLRFFLYIFSYRFLFFVFSLVSCSSVDLCWLAIVLTPLACVIEEKHTRLGRFGFPPPPDVLIHWPCQHRI